MKMLQMLKRVFFRGIRIITGNKGVYCKKGKKNHVASGTILYEPCVIGKYNYFAPYTLVYNAKIGNYCSIGPGCKIGLADHDVKAISTRSIINNGYGGMQMFSNPAIVGSDVWLGSNVVVKQGVKIGNGAVIGANAVVTKDIPAYAIAVGAPAKVIKYRFAENKIKELQLLKWFEYDIEDAYRIVREINIES